MASWSWFTVLGLGLDIAGAAILATGLFVSEQRALELGLMRLSGDTDEVNLKLPAVADRLKQSTRAKWGLGFLVLGFLLQAVGSALSAAQA